MRGIVVFKRRRPIAYICSPYRGDISQNTDNARKYCRFAIEHGAIPIAPHPLFPQFMDDSVACECEAAMQMNLAIMRRCDEVWVFGEKVSEGMAREIEEAERLGVKIRHLRGG